MKLRLRPFDYSSIADLTLMARWTSLYENLGYVKIGEIPEFTLWNGKFWADFRYFKRFLTE